MKIISDEKIKETYKMLPCEHCPEETGDCSTCKIRAGAQAQLEDDKIEYDKLQDINQQLTDDILLLNNAIENMVEIKSKEDYGFRLEEVQDKALEKKIQSIGNCELLVMMSEEQYKYIAGEIVSQLKSAGVLKGENKITPEEAKYLLDEFFQIKFKGDEYFCELEKQIIAKLKKIAEVK